MHQRPPAPPGWQPGGPLSPGASATHPDALRPPVAPQHPVMNGQGPEPSPRPPPSPGHPSYPLPGVASPPLRPGSGLMLPPQQTKAPNGAMPSPGLQHSMQAMSLQSPPLSSPGLLQSVDAQPARTKRSQRAYHRDDPAHGGMASPPPPHAPFVQGGAPAQQMQQQQEPQQRFHPDRPQHPYADAPPASAPPPEEEENPHAISQPPHSAGQRLQGPRSRIDPNQIPSPVDVLRLDQDKYDQEPFMTCSRGAIPQSMTDFVAVDQGNCTPRFLRLTTYALPHSDDLAVAAQLPLGIIVQPFAEPKSEEGPVPLVDFGETGPPRCDHCRGYINPWCQFVNGGQRFICNLCGGTSEVPAEYFAHLDVSGRRVDLEQRPELYKGSVDFAVPKAYWAQTPALDPMAAVNSAAAGRAAPTAAGATITASSEVDGRIPEPMRYVFAIDVSWQAAQSGVIQQVARSLKILLYGVNEDDTELVDTPDVVEPKNSLPPGAKVAIVTFDRTVHFYNIRPGLEQAQMLVVPDIDDMFVPLNDGLLIDPVECRSVIVSLLDSLPTLFGQTQTVEAALGGAVRAGLVALRHFGGQVILFQSSLPTIGPGALKHREDNKLYGTDKERTLFTPQETFYRTVAEECAEAGIGVNLFLFPSQYIDVASLGVLAGLTGGEAFFHPRFDPVRDGLRLRSELLGVVERFTGYSATMRIRCSNGLRIADHYGNFYQRNNTDLEFGTLDADKAVAAIIKHEGKLDEKTDAYLQCATLYTSANGQRRVRCHNVSVPISSKLGDVFRLADMDTTIAVVAKECITQSLSKSLRDVRDQLTDTCVKVLLAYRKHCASATSPGQLILPESYKLFPVFALALMKTKALKGGPVASDVRTFYMRIIKSIGVSATIELLYPRMYQLHRLDRADGLADESGRLRVPTLMRTSYARMEVHGAYLIENGETAIVWLGSQVSPRLLQDLYGVDSLEELDTRMTALPKLPTHLSTQVRNLLAHLESRHRHRKLPLLIARQHLDGTEYEFSSMLVEDSHSDALSYVDYLCSVHKRIQLSLSGEKRDEADVTSSLWRGAW